MACKDDSVTDLPQATVPVVFSTSESVREDNGQDVKTRGGATVLMTQSNLEVYGFGVYAFYTGNSKWNSVGASTIPNFMYNQQVSYGFVDSGINSAWIYSPVKYWPNNNNPADDGSATAPQDRNYLSFFAYAPFFSNTDDGSMIGLSEDERGIVGETANTETGSPMISYRWAQLLSQQVDLLWASTIDQFKYDDSGTHTEGNVNGKVNLQFYHALSALDIVVRRVYDETTPGTPPLKPDDEADTKIFVSRLTLNLADNLYDEGKLRLYDGAWPTEYLNRGSISALDYATAHFAENVKGTTSDNLDVIADIELNKFGTEGTGVDEKLRLLIPSATSQLIIPQSVTLTPTITYSFVTHDDALELDYLTDNEGHRYSRILNTVTSATPVTINFEGGKRFILICNIGVEHVNFEVVTVEDWDFPIRFWPDDIEEYIPVEIEKTVKEPDN